MIIPYTHDYMTLWELAHRLCGKNPYRFSWLPLHPEVKDTVRSLLNEIHHDRLDSSLIYEKREYEQDGPPEFYLRYHLDDIFKCIGGKKYPRKLLKFIYFEKWEFWHWCEMTGYPLPDFWYSLNLGWEYNSYTYWDDYYGIIKLEDIDTKERFKEYTEREKDRIRARYVANQLWEKDRSRPALDIARSDEMTKLVGRYTDRTITKWIQAVMPEELLNKKGRPKKKIEVDKTNS